METNLMLFKYKPHIQGKITDLIAFGPTSIRKDTSTRFKSVMLW